MSRITGILLAAGRARRFGGNKLLHKLEDGTPMLLQAARTLQAALPHTLVVVHPEDHLAMALLEAEGLESIPNPDADSGMGTSIACGVQASADAEGWVIALADMPYLQTRTILSVASGLVDPWRIVAPRFGERRGHPVGFGKGYARALRQLAGDEGARQIIAAHPEELELFATWDRGTVIDIDTPQDLHGAASI